VEQMQVTHTFLTGGKKLMVSASLKHYEDLLPENEFIRVHLQQFNKI